MKPLRKFDLLERKWEWRKVEQKSYVDVTVKDGQNVLNN